MSTEIVSRERVDGSPTTWLVAEDLSGLGLTDCGCGQPQDRRIVQSRGPNVLEVVFHHADGERCMLAFVKPDFRPLTHEEYLSLFPVVAEEEL